MGSADLKLGVILQARMGSARLPGKILKLAGTKPLLEHILFRLSYLRHPAHKIIATTNLPQDDIVADFCHNHDVDCYRGSELDVLDRYYCCAKSFGFHHIVRLTGDNPFVDIEELDNMITLHLEKGADYSHSFKELPIGVGSEIFSYSALEQSHILGRNPNHREHANEYIQENPALFNIITHEPSSTKKRHPEVRLTVDTLDDLERASFIVKHCSNEYVSTGDAILLSQRFSECSQND